MLARRAVGGVAALVAAGTFVVGLVLFATVLTDYTMADDAPESVAFLVDNQALLSVWNLVIHIVFGIALVPLALVLHEGVKAHSPALARAATVFGIMWAGLIIATGMITNIGFATIVDLSETDPARAETVWSALDAVQNGLGGGNEVVGGLWVLLLSGAALSSAGLPKELSYLGMACGAAGLLTVVPPLEAFGAIFGVGLIVWFAWTGLVLLRSSGVKAELDQPVGPATVA